jgi:serine/threonine protein phosphatase PrpC
MVAAVTRNGSPVGSGANLRSDARSFKSNARAVEGERNARPSDEKQNPRFATGLSRTQNPLFAGFTSRGLGGGRYEGKQQDRIGYGTASKLPTAEIAKRASRRAFAEAEKATEDFLEGGSTATAVVVTPDHKAVIVNVGDSPALLILENKETGKVVVTKITTDHPPDSPDERRRIEEAGGIVDENGRVVGPDGTLAVSRSFGDGNYTGVSAEPAVKVLDLKGVLANPKIRASIVACSDGMTDHTSEEKIAAEFKKGRTPKQIVESLKKLAFEDAAAAGVEESDNISVVVARLDPNAKKAVYIAVTDGHGTSGGAVAGKVRDQIHHWLHNPEGKAEVTQVTRPKTRPSFLQHRTRQTASA